MPQSESVAKLVEALSKAQAEFTTLVKDKTGQEGNLKFKYTQLPDALAMVRPLLNKHGIFLSQPIVKTEDGPRQINKVQLGDEWIADDGLPVPNISPGKELGKVITYGRRISLFPFLAISGEDDDEDAPDLKPAPQTQGKTYPSVNQKPATPNNSPRPNENKLAAAKTTGTQIIYSVPQKFEEVVTNGVITGLNGIPENGIKEINAKKDNSVMVGGNTESDINPDIPLDAVPDFNSLPIKEREEYPDDCPQDVVTFVPLTPQRYEEIQNTLKGFLARKITGVPERKFRSYLEFRHEGKKSFEVPAWKWEETFKLLSDAYNTSDQAVKDLLLPAKV